MRSLQPSGSPHYLVEWRCTSVEAERELFLILYRVLGLHQQPQAMIMGCNADPLTAPPKRGGGRGSVHTLNSAL